MFDLHEEFVTKKEFNELLKKLQDWQKEQSNQSAPVKKYLKKQELKIQLSISDSTIWRLTINGVIEPKEFAGIIYYDWEKITQKMKPYHGKQRRKNKVESN